MKINRDDRVKISRVDGEPRDPWGTVMVVESTRALVRFNDGHEEWVDRFAVIEVRHKL